MKKINVSVEEIKSVIKVISGAVELNSGTVIHKGA